MAPVRKALAAVFPGDDTSGFFSAVIERAAASGAEVTALHVIDPVWLRYSEADWLSTGPSRADYESYMRDTLLEQGERLLLDLMEEARSSSSVTAPTTKIAYGDPAEEVIKAATAIGAAEIIASAGCPCLREIKKKSPCPVLVI
jgi:nucleotide-binding universal stress UspA family protein